MTNGRPACQRHHSPSSRARCAPGICVLQHPTNVCKIQGLSDGASIHNRTMGVRKVEHQQVMSKQRCPNNRTCSLYSLLRMDSATFSCFSLKHPLSIFSCQSTSALPRLTSASCASHSRRPCRAACIVFSATILSRCAAAAACSNTACSARARFLCATFRPSGSCHSYKINLTFTSRETVICHSPHGLPW